MLTDQITHKIQDIEFRVKYSGRRTLGISVLPDSSVIVRAPYFTSFKTIKRIVQQKARWIINHRVREKEKSKLNGSYINGEIHLLHGNEYILKIKKSNKTYLRLFNNTIEIGLEKTDDTQTIKRLLYKRYKNDAMVVLPDIMDKILIKYEAQMFKPTGLVIRSMKSRWGSCSKKGIITLSTELIKLSDRFIEYVILHELCHLKHHNHSQEYYKLLTEVFPDWKSVRRELKNYIR